MNRVELERWRTNGDVGATMGLDVEKRDAGNRHEGAERSLME